MFLRIRPKKTKKKPRETGGGTPIQPMPKGGDIFKLIGIALGSVTQGLPELWRKLQNLVETNYQLGCSHVERGNLRDAVMRFKFALWLNANHYPSLYNLGCCYVSLDRKDEAAQCFRKALKIWPGYDEARFMLAMVDPKEQVSRMPQALVLNHFAAVAPVYDQENVEIFGYRGPQLAFDAAIEQFGPEANGLRVLDLGCGTGLSGAPLRSRAAQIVGVDICTEMLAQARARRSEDVAVYDEAHEQDLLDWLAAPREATFDVVTAVHVLPYLGDLDAIFAGASKVLSSGGLFVFTAEILKEGTYHLLPGIGRFGHHPDYLAGLASRHGFALASLSKVSLFKDYAAQLGVCRRL